MYTVDFIFSQLLNPLIAAFSFITEPPHTINEPNITKRNCSQVITDPNVVMAQNSQEVASLQEQWYC